MPPGVWRFVPGEELTLQEGCRAAPFLHLPAPSSDAGGAGAHNSPCPLSGTRLRQMGGLYPPSADGFRVGLQCENMVIPLFVCVGGGNLYCIKNTCRGFRPKPPAFSDLRWRGMGGAGVMKRRDREDVGGPGMRGAGFNANPERCPDCRTAMLPSGKEESEHYCLHYIALKIVLIFIIFFLTVFKGENNYDKKNYASCFHRSCSAAPLC